MITSISDYDAWLIASLTADRDPGLGVRPGAEPWSLWAEQLRKITPPERAAAWRGWLDAPHFDGEAISRAIIEVDIQAPPPVPAEAGLLPGSGDVITVCLDSVVSRPVEWLWPDRVPLGKITLLAGEAKLGKSFLTMDLIARVSAGLEIPGRADGECMPRGSVILLSAEDDAADTIVPRLNACGADLSKVHTLETVRLKSGALAPFNLSYIPHLERAVVDRGDARLVIIDPVPHYVGNGTDDHKNAQTRQLLEPLKDMAARLRVAVLLVTHLNKGNGTKALNRVTGSGAYTALARSNWLLVKDKDDPKRRLFLSAGTNLVEDHPGLAFRVGGEPRRVEWEPDPVLMTADEALEASVEATKEKPKKVQLARQWLEAQFSPGIRILSADLLAEGEKAEHKRDALFRAKDDLDIKAKKHRDDGGAWSWFLGDSRHFDGSTLRRFDASENEELPPGFRILTILRDQPSKCRTVEVSGRWGASTVRRNPPANK